MTSLILRKDILRAESSSALRKRTIPRTLRSVNGLSSPSGWREVCCRYFDGGWKRAERHRRLRWMNFFIGSHGESTVLNTMTSSRLEYGKLQLDFITRIRNGCLHADDASTRLEDGMFQMQRKQVDEDSRNQPCAVSDSTDGSPHEPTQTTAQRYKISVPTKAKFLGDLGKSSRKHFTHQE